MSESTLVVKEIVAAGVASALAAANADGSKWLASGGDTFLHVKNAGGGAIDVTVIGQKTVKVPGVGDIVAPNIVVEVPASTGDMKIGPIPDGYLDAEGYAHCTFEGVTSVTVAAFRARKVA